MNETVSMQGLTSEDAKKRQLQFGKNLLTLQRNQEFASKLLHIVGEPMFLLLIIAAVIYFFLGEPRDGAVMLVFVLGMISIEVVQEWKTDRTLEALKDLSAPRVKVIRDGLEQTVASEDLVPGDVMLVSEGVKIPADGRILKANDLLVDESMLTGESQGVWKTAQCEPQGVWRKDYVYAGTLVTQGSATVIAEKIGLETEYGKIGRHVAEAPERPTPLEKQTRRLVKTCSVFALALFLLTVLLTYATRNGLAFGERLIESLLAGITLAMAIIPEEFPVITAVFLSMGAWRLAKKNSLVRKLPSVETLGAISVLCVDKTGTITLNQMTVQEAWPFAHSEEQLIETMGLACETSAYDPMEKAMLRYCEQRGVTREHLFESEFCTEYAFTDTLKMMGHVWRHEEQLMVAAKGSPEQILSLCSLAHEERAAVDEKLLEMSQKGLRVIAVGFMVPSSEDDIPKSITDCQLTLSGLIGLLDPPRPSVKEDIQRCTRAGVRVIMITGDNGVTASAIARQIGMPGSEDIITGVELGGMSDEDLRERVKHVSVFSRVVPEHKMRIVQALKDNGEIVAMTGDGVNDAPALKHSDIGIAMGKRGSEVSREAADLVLLDDNFSTIVDTMADGRRIYNNIQKAIGYVFSVHIPIAFAALLAPLLRIPSDDVLLLPLHVMLMELIIDPTCSIVLERQPGERDSMLKKPRSPNEKILTPAVMLKSVAQGIALLAAFFGSYYVMLRSTGDGELARTMGLSIIMIANVFLVQVNTSATDSILRSIRRLSKDKLMWIISLATPALLLAILYTPLHTLLRLTPLTPAQLLLAFGIGAASVLWYELVKLVRRIRLRRGNACPK